MAKLDRVYEQSKDLHVATYIIYDDDDDKAYADAACETQMTTSELFDAFIKGAVIKLKSGDYAYPIGYEETSDVGSVTYIVPNGTTATSADIAALAAVADE